MSSLPTQEEGTEDATAAIHAQYMRRALSLARLSPPKPTNYRVGALLVHFPHPHSTSAPKILSTGYTLELPGNTHAEQNCLSSLAAAHNLPASRAADALPPRAAGTVVLYTTMEPCVERLSGNEPCVDRILGCRRGEDGRMGVDVVVCGGREPDVFVKGNSARGRLVGEGVEVVYLRGFEEEVVEVATAGHVKSERG